jgi:putative copper resistance protein D
VNPFADKDLTMICLAAARAVHFGACLLWFGVLAFDRLVAIAPEFRGYTETAIWWRSRLRRIAGVALPLVLLSGVAWFAVVAANMSGLSLAESVQTQIWSKVWNDTLFGNAWKFRLMLWIAIVLVNVLAHVFKKLVWLELWLGAFLLGSLAWAGHGHEGSAWHLGADVLHLLLAGFWPAGLLPLMLVLRKFQRPPNPDSVSVSAMVIVVRRFSMLSLISVSLLAITGLVNGWFLVGSVAHLLQQTYGRWLLAKLVLFCLAISFGAVNLLRWKPQLLKFASTGNSAGEVAATNLRKNMRIELVMGSVIIVIVAVLGMLPPATH